MDLFTLASEKKFETIAPLAQRLRPRTLEEFAGQRHFIGEGKFINRVVESKNPPSMIFYGPPGVGKTTLARMMAGLTGFAFEELSAVTSGVKELRGVLDRAKDLLHFEGRRTILFIDEIHRFNKGQQDALLPYVEQGKVIFIGATTENPFFEVNAALISRCQILHFHPLEEEDLKKILNRALYTKERGYGDMSVEITSEGEKFLLEQCGGDSRTLLNTLETAYFLTPKEGETRKITLSTIQTALQKKKVFFDKNGSNHYDTISAFIKSMRGSDPDAAVYWLAKMLEGGEDPKFIGRRMIIFASEDIGNADPGALPLAVSTFQAVEVIGLPEGRIPLAQCAIYLSCAEKSNRSYVAINEAMNAVAEKPIGEVPLHLRSPINPRVKEEKTTPYRYPHHYEGAYVEQSYLPEELEKYEFYRPSDRGEEVKIKERMERRRGKRKKE